MITTEEITFAKSEHADYLEMALVAARMYQKTERQAFLDYANLFAARAETARTRITSLTSSA